MRKLQVAFCKKTTSQGFKPLVLTWPGNGPAALTEPGWTTEDREEVPLIMAGTNDGKRGDAHVTARSMLVMDVDCKPEKKDGVPAAPAARAESEAAWRSRSGKVRADFMRALEFLGGPEGYDHAWHTTHSHTDTDRLGWRVWLPLAEDVPALQFARWRDANHAMNARVFRLVCDTTAYNPERLMRLPALHPGRAEAYKSGYRCDGKLLRFEELVEWHKALPPEQRNKTSRGQRTADMPRLYSPATSGEFALPTALVSKLRIQCAQIAQGNQRLKLETRAALEAIAMCETLQPGQRDNGLIGLVGFFAHRFLEIETKPLLDSLLLPVLEKTHADDPDDPIKPNIPDPRDLCDWAIAQVDMRRRDDANPLGHTKVSDTEQGYIRDWTHCQRSGGMSEDEFRLLAQSCGVDAETMKRRLFVVFGRDTYVWQVNAYNARPMHMREMTLDYAQAVLAGVGVSRRVFDEQKSEFKALTLPGIIARHSVNAVDVRASYLEPRSHFDEASSTFVEAMGIKAKLPAERHEVIHEWLLTLGGEKLVDWVSCVSDVSRALSILFLIMPRNSGKNLLAHGLSRIWQAGTPVRVQDAVSEGFNGDLAGSPFVFADEELPRMRNGSLGAELRRIVSDPEVVVRRKFMPNVKCSGYLRMLIAANGDAPLKGFASNGQPTDADLEAIAERLLTIECDARAADYLLQYGREEVDSWRSENKVAKHALWLAANWKVKDQGRRFVVEGNSTQALRKLVINDELTAQVLDWFITYGLHSTKKTSSNVRQGLFAHEGELYVSLSVIVATWSDFRPAYRMASSEPFVHALESVCHPGRVNVRRGADTRQYWRVKFDYLEFYAKRLGHGADAVRRAIMERDDPAAQFVADDAPGEVLPLKPSKTTLAVAPRQHIEEI
jgi:hypothetical protein